MLTLNVKKDVIGSARLEAEREDTPSMLKEAGSGAGLPDLALY